MGKMTYEELQALCDRFAKNKTKLEARIATLEAENAALKEKLERYNELLHDGFTVYSNLSKRACLRTSGDNVSDVLDAINEAYEKVKGEK